MLKKRQKGRNLFYDVFSLKNHRGLSAIVATLLIILLTLVAVGIIWAVVRNVVQSGAEQIELGQFTLDLQIKAAQIQNGDVTVVVVRRNPGQGEFVGMNFVFSDGQNSETIRQDVSLQELEERSFTFRLAEISTSNLKTVSVAPIYKTSSGKESTGRIADVFDVPANKSMGGVEGNFVALGFTGLGMREYTISSGEEEPLPTFTKVIIDPLDVRVGSNQTFTAYVSSPYNITEVTTKTQLDNELLVLPLELKPDGSYSATWTVYDTHTTTYRTNFTARDSAGNENTVTMSWTDPCTVLSDHGQTLTLSTPCVVGVSGVDGVDVGNIVLSTGGSITLESGSNFIFTPGNSVTFSGGKIIQNGGSLRKAYIYYPDPDGDNYAENSTYSWAVTPSVSGKVRANTAVTTTDCDANNDLTFQALSGLIKDADQDGYSTGGDSNVCVGNPTTINGRTYYNNVKPAIYDWVVTSQSLGTDCSDISSRVQVNKASFSDGDADTYTVSAGTLCSSVETFATSACNTAGSSYSKGLIAPACHLISSLSGTDCYDSNSNAKPGQTAWFTTNRGDGSFDYNCDSSANQQFTSSGSCGVDLYGDDFPACTQFADAAWCDCGGGAIGWSGGTPACGASGEYFASTTFLCPGGNGCVGTSNTQGCH